MSLHLKSSNYDFYQYKIESNLNLTRNHYKVTVEYEHDWIQYRSGRDPYCRFDTSSMILEVYNRARVTETTVEHLKISATNLITGVTVTRTVKITWILIEPTVTWTDETLTWVHPIVEIVYELENYKNLRMSIVGDNIIQVESKDDEQYLIKHYYVQSSMPIADNEKELTLYADSELQPYITWDPIFRKLYVDRTAPLDGSYELEFTLQCKYLKNTIKKSILVLYGSQDNSVPLTSTPHLDETTINLIGADSVSVPETGEGYDNFYYQIQSNPVYNKNELSVTYDVINPPCENAVLFYTTSMVLKVKKGLKYENTSIKIKISINGYTYEKIIAVTNNLYTILQG